MAHPFTGRVETAPMINAVWRGTLAPTVAALIVARPGLGHRLALAPRRVLHALAAFIPHAVEQGWDTSDIAVEVDARDIRDLLAYAIPNAHPRLLGLFDRLGDQSMGLAFYRRLNEALRGSASNLLLNSDAVDEARLGFIEQLVSDPVLLAAQQAIGMSEANLQYLKGALAFLRATGLSLDVEQLPLGSGWRAIRRRIMSDLGRAAAPPLPCRCPSGWRHVRTMSGLFQMGKDLRNCLAGIGLGGDHHLLQFLSGAELVFVSDDEASTLASVQSVGPSLWMIGEVAVGRIRPTAPPRREELRVALAEVLAEVGHTLLDASPAWAFRAIARRAERTADPGEHHDVVDIV